MAADKTDFCILALIYAPRRRIGKVPICLIITLSKQMFSYLERLQKMDADNMAKPWLLVRHDRHALREQEELGLDWMNNLAKA